ncbi:UNVERIFIED_CONTAM: hypothetical protein FKN15_025321 [Acipenser sinensis]
MEGIAKSALVVWRLPAVTMVLVMMGWLNKANATAHWGSPGQRVDSALPTDMDQTVGVCNTHNCTFISSLGLKNAVALCMGSVLKELMEMEAASARRAG